MKKRLQVILVGSMLLPGSTGVLLASNPHCRTWVAQAAIHTAANVVEQKRHYSKKVLAAWAVWRAAHPNAKPIRRTPLLRPGSFVSRPVPDALGFLCDVSVPTVDEAITTLLQPIEIPPGEEVPDVPVDTTGSPFILTPDAVLPPNAPISGWPPIFNGPTGYGAPPTTRTSPPSAPPSGSLPPGLPPSGPPPDSPPTTGSPVPPPPTIPVAVAAEPSSLLLLGTGVVVSAGLFRRRKLLS